MKEVKRCFGSHSEIYSKYHDEEWGIPVYDDHKLFEMLILESAHAGLSWELILNKRENYRRAYDNFDVQKIAEWNDEKIQELLQDAGIVRNRMKILSATRNAKVFMKIQEEFGSFSNYLWGLVDDEPVKGSWTEHDEMPTKTQLSDDISKDLKKRGMNFVGSIIIYSYLQAVGVVNDHFVWCHCYSK